MTEPAATRSWQLADLHHVGLTVADIERSIHFYRDLLGLELIRLRPRVTADYVAQQTGYAGVELSVASFLVRHGWEFCFLRQRTDCTRRKW